MKNYWTKEEEQMLFTDMTNEDIAAALGRTVKAVQTKRYRMTGRSVEGARQKITRREKEANQKPSPTKILRICEMARRLGVKLLGEVTE